MTLADKALPIKRRWSIYILQKWRGDGRKNLLPTGALRVFKEAKGRNARESSVSHRLRKCGGFLSERNTCGFGESRKRRKEPEERLARRPHKA